MEEIIVRSWNELNDALFGDAWQPALGRFRSTYAFRGLADARYDIQTSLRRLGGAYATLEEPLLRTFRRYAQGDAVPSDSLWNWLAVAQHHGLPTRLLDWTYSPYVALHFATQDVLTHHRDGSILCADYVRSIEYLPPSLRALLAEESASVFTAETLSRGAPSLRHLGQLSETPFMLFFEPPSLDARIVNQYALFSLMSDATADLRGWLQQHPDLVRRIVIPADLKWELRDRLDQANITERVLFPGLDGLSHWLRRYYSPRPERRHL